MNGNTVTTVAKFSRDQRREMNHQIACVIPKTSDGGILIDTTSFGHMTPKLQVCAWLYDKIERLEGLSVEAQHDLIVLTAEKLFTRGLLRFDHNHTQAILETNFQQKHRKIQHKRRAKVLVKEFEAEWTAEQAWLVHQERSFRDRNVSKKTVELAPE